MTKLKLAVAMIFACSILVGCASSHSVIDQSWIQKPAKVKVVFTEPHIDSPKDLQDDLPDYVNNFSDWYKSQLETNLGAQTKGVLYSVERISQDLIKTETVSENGSSFWVPAISEMNPEADVYLVINDIWIGRIVSETTCSMGGGFGVGGGVGMGTTCSQNKDFTAKGRYAYYDAKTGKRLGYGDIEAKSGYTFTVSLSDWENVVEKTVSTVLENTPIKK